MRACMNARRCVRRAHAGGATGSSCATRNPARPGRGRGPATQRCGRPRAHVERVQAVLLRLHQRLHPQLGRGAVLLAADACHKVQLVGACVVKGPGHLECELAARARAIAYEHAQLVAFPPRALGRDPLGDGLHVGCQPFPRGDARVAGLGRRAGRGALGVGDAARRDQNPVLSAWLDSGGAKRMSGKVSRSQGHPLRMCMCRHVSAGRVSGGRMVDGLGNCDEHTGMNVGSMCSNFHSVGRTMVQPWCSCSPSCAAVKSRKSSPDDGSACHRDWLTNCGTQRAMPQALGQAECSQYPDAWQRCTALWR